MIEIIGNIWEIPSDWICIPTNGFIKGDGTAVMGRGLAYQAKQKYAGIDQVLGSRLKDRGNRVLTLQKSLVPDAREPSGYREKVLLSFPVKGDWRDQADLNLIRESCRQLHKLWEESTLVTQKVKVVVLPRVGCGNGRRKWSEVKPILEEELPEESFVIVSLVE